MKKICLVLVLMMGAFCAKAQVIESSRLWDNWSIGLRAGGITPLTHSAIIKNMRPAFGLEINKQLTPVFGLSAQGMAAVNFMPSANAIDATDISLIGRVNLMNLFGGYSGTPRVFELEALLGAGWLRYFRNAGLGPDQNALSSRVGLNFNFNLGESKAWTLSLRPAIAYDMEGGFRDLENPMKDDKFNANHAMFELTAGIAYHFKTSSGDRYLSAVKAFDQGQIDDMNASINSLRNELNDKESALDAAKRKADALQQELTNCQNKPAPAQQVVEKAGVPETIVTFRQNRSTVDNSQLPNVERVGTYLKNHPNMKVTIKGYASPEGPAEVNARIAQARAEAVKKILVKKYGIDESRISAEGQGVGDMFSKPDWNRVSICTIAE
ncbi:MAG: OmpA family protein [Mediterranea sp.]|jgi:outer membrane protein OmpA-like peptidoglycan-associated protein|nr:OmpA family protein [Mediterranea sp.]